MVILNHRKQKNLYNRDLNLWILETIDLLQQGNFASVDIDNLIEELAAMGGSHNREVTNRLTTIIRKMGLKPRHERQAQGKASSTALITL